ncbi:hypothetical protein PNEG_03458 [Pneumocystis murina B123]|uniref:Dolichyl-diphosphooligosaccharide--protein glycosyltransferase subunit WBP1 n=1 Tax=Pneumocystis murina (strain B123) TaxID=1069680 RepID=M7NLK4_PNEMU|nr:hypothetical protein PNEG_03458 [Pneumocystis murina B123]EMR08016.1 hypothetical protein PNEG_03458 [Pneumocystis murina B123]
MNLYKFIRIFFGLILVFGIKLILGKSFTGDKLLIVHNSDISYNDFSLFFDSFKIRGYNLTFKDPEIDSISLFKYEKRIYDHLILFLTKEKNIKIEYYLPNSKIYEFIDQGGNILIATLSTAPKNIRNFTSELGIYLAEQDTLVVDHFSYDKSDSQKHSLLLIDNFKKNNYVLSDEVIKGPPILYRGISHFLGNGQLIVPILTTGRTAYSYNTKDESNFVKKPWVAGSQTYLITGFQARNNARIIVTGSIEMFSNNFFNSYFKKNLKFGNQKFAEDITEWLFQEKSVLKVVSIKHNLAHKTLDTNPPNIYKVKDNVTFEITLSQYKNGLWIPFVVSDIQLELIMLDPYIRTVLKETSRIPNSSIYSTTFSLPDHYGVFHFKVNYKRPGLSYIEERSTVTIRHYRHDEFPRYLFVAFPYYVGATTTIFSFLFFCFIWLFDISLNKKVMKKNQ